MNLHYCIFNIPDLGIRFSKRHKASEPDWSYVRAELEKHFDFVISPLENATKEYSIAYVYVSDNKEGLYRNGSFLNMWAVKGLKNK